MAAAAADADGVVQIALIIMTNIMMTITIMTIMIITTAAAAADADGVLHGGGVHRGLRHPGGQAHDHHIGQGVCIYAYVYYLHALYIYIYIYIYILGICMISRRTSSR
jgi:hypothetical protein